MQNTKKSLTNFTKSPNSVKFRKFLENQFEKPEFFRTLFLAELPKVHSAFRFSGFPVGVITQLWLEQCFLNYLKLEVILCWLVSSVVLGPDYSIYLVVAIFKHLQSNIIDAQINQVLILKCSDNCLNFFILKNFFKNVLFFFRTLCFI